MQYQDAIDQMPPEIYERLRQAVELGRWPDGSPVSPEQRDHALQAVIAWGEKHLPPEQRVGYIDKGHKAGEVCDDPAEVPLAWRNSPDRT
ncbi:YeaC family protein [Haliea atlantica]|jgi:hypothetical protein|nr:hypothetical protein [Haliea sp.]MAL96637.1 hypothetical protein [Haliea sp.]|tara:strand:+ start:172467 stop:172736 length:270 start_codon:yes stop_codon:yes gene_type:complete